MLTLKPKVYGRLLVENTIKLTIAQMDLIKINGMLHYLS